MPWFENSPMSMLFAVPPYWTKVHLAARRTQIEGGDQAKLWLEMWTRLFIPFLQDCHSWRREHQSNPLSKNLLVVSLSQPFRGKALHTFCASYEYSSWLCTFPWFFGVTQGRTPKQPWPRCYCRQVMAMFVLNQALLAGLAQIQMFSHM